MLSQLNASLLIMNNGIFKWRLTLGELQKFKQLTKSRKLILAKLSTRENELVGVTNF